MRQSGDNDNLCDKTQAITVNRFLPTFAAPAPSNVKPLRKPVAKRTI